AVSLTLALLGNTVLYHTLLKDGHWGERNTDKRIPWTSIQGLSVGLFGFGRIGKIIYKMLKGFDVNFYTIHRGKDYPSDVNTVKNITNLIQVSDVIIISTPLNSETEELFDDDLFAIMKNKYLINVGRGKIVKESSLYEALQNGMIAGYASDVWYQYPKGKEKSLPSTYPIQEFDNVILSNHSGGYTTNTNDEVNRDLLKTLEDIVNEKFDNQLDLDNII
ncbi:MAG: hydroxyacid dehydrogenase, partial [Bacilli bacterium]|nr:hydroxyacid dehydrogenase [Bacilli bacterium]